MGLAIKSSSSSSGGNSSSKRHQEFFPSMVLQNQVRSSRALQENCGACNESVAGVQARKKSATTMDNHAAWRPVSKPAAVSGGTSTAANFENQDHHQDASSKENGHRKGTKKYSKKKKQYRAPTANANDEQLQQSFKSVDEHVDRQLQNEEQHQQQHDPQAHLNGENFGPRHQHSPRSKEQSNGEFKVNKNFDNLKHDERGEAQSPSSTNWQLPLLTSPQANTAAMDPVSASCIARLRSEFYHRTTGTYLMEVEKVLEAVTPTLRMPNSAEADGACCCLSPGTPRLPHTCLKTVWEWYDEPSTCGVEVRSYRDTTSGSFKAYFVPYLSAMQLFEEGTKSLLFQYSETSLPHNRLPLLQKIQSLARQGTTLLEEAGNLHPSSWFAVWWCPIYKIPDGQLHTAFLTYHSLGHVCRRDAMLLLPVIGLQTHRCEPEQWLNSELELPQQRISTLEKVAETLSASSGHHDYNFCTSHRDKEENRDVRCAR